MKVKSFHISEKGNSKVHLPVINLGSGTHCPSRTWCPFARENHKNSGRKLCYAQKIEGFRHTALLSRERNASIIRSASKDEQSELACAIAGRIAKHATLGTVRMNESGDLCDENIHFACVLVKELARLGVRVYLYSKAPMRLIRRIRNAGATVLQSERDFVAVPDIETGKALGIPACPGVCGPCMRCPDGKRSYIIEH